jgi:WD40 repeat protein
LDWSKHSYRITSSGADNKILIWDLEDYNNRISGNTFYQINKRELNTISTTENLQISPIIELPGHTDNIEDIAFSSGFRDLLVSVGDDKYLNGWDLRTN